MPTRCCRCKLSSPDITFPRNSSKPDGLNATCHGCTSEKNRETRIRKKLRVISHYSGGEPHCSCCDEKRLEFLTVDHIDGGGIAHRKEVGDIYQWAINNDFPPVLRVLCMNCNHSFGMYGYCPHKTESLLVAKTADVRFHRIPLDKVARAKDLIGKVSISEISRMVGMSRRAVRSVKRSAGL